MPTIRFDAADLSDDERRKLLSRALDKAMGASDSCYIQAVHTETAVTGTLTYTCYRWASADGQGGTYQCDWSLDDDYAVTLGDSSEVVGRMVYEPVAFCKFSLTSIPKEGRGSDVLYRNARLFKVGDYGDKGLSHPVTSEDLKHIVSTFRAGKVKVNAEHKPLPAMLSGKLGEVEAVRVDDTGEWLLGDVALPNWLDSTITDEQKQLSVELLPDSLLLTGLALTDNPRVQGAALVAAFNAYQAGTSTASRVGTASKVTGGSPAPLTKTTTTKEKGTVKEFFQKFIAFCKGEGIDIDEADLTANMAADETPEAKRLKELEAENKRLREAGAQSLEQKAAAFADALADRILPVERPAVIAAFSRAAEDDKAAPVTINFTAADGTAKSGSRVDQLREIFALRPAHNLTAELIEAQAGDAVLFDRAGSGGGKESDKGPVASDIYKRRREDTARAAGQKG